MALSQNNLSKLFLRLKPVNIVTSLKRGPKYATQISKDVDCTYSHVVKLLEELEDLGLVSFKKQGRIKVIELTEDGQDLAHSIEGVMMKLNRVKETADKKK